MHATPRSAANLALCLTIALAATPAQETPPPTVPTAEPAKPIYELPKDPTAVILSLDFDGGFTPGRKIDAPILTVHANGKVVVRDVFGLGDRPQSVLNLTPDEVQQLLRMVIAEHRLDQWDQKAVDRAIAARRRAGDKVPGVQDAATSIVGLTLPKHSAHAEVYALDFLAPYLTKVPEVPRLLAVQKRLRTLAAITTAGGRQKVQTYVAAVAAKMKSESKGRKPFTIDELSSASRNRLGHVLLVFVRERRAANGKVYDLSAIVEDRGAAKPRIQIAEVERPF